MIDIEVLGLIAATLTTTAFVPQVYKAWKDKSTRDISLVMYLVLCIGLVLWMIYGVLIQSLPVILANAITFLLVGAMVVLKIRHK
ncbi:SemiSWEET transporter [Muriicola sp. Z0-33]|uniref:SemiSWEET transporter n=1 Tax=Muriicola sp. Z0-33 TaxID=2816957 RepID=UPI0022388E94|nr:SemiSWEET transporter [Muriicola sp. Z0-33]MCW5515013.1 SemiSWEET family sugar transporter [Muriicola sp. Z0-33]